MKMEILFTTPIVIINNLKKTVMKKLIFLIFLHGILLTISCQAQQIDEIQVLEDGHAVFAYEEYHNIKINNEISFDELFKLNSWKTLIDIFGEPKEFEENNNKVKPYKILQYNGAKFNYQYVNLQHYSKDKNYSKDNILKDNFTLRYAEFTSSAYFLTVEGKKIYPGMPVEKLKNYIPTVFRSQKDNTIEIHSTISGTNKIAYSYFFSIYTDSATKKVKKIRVVNN